jgi:DNA-binding NarL/FixJ family response regulator
MARHLSILLAEPSFLLRQKLACALAREEGIWCVAQVQGLNELMRGVTNMRPDFILADLNILKDGSTIDFIRNSSGVSRIIGLVDSEAAPYEEIARGLGLDGIIDKARIADSIRQMIKELVKSTREIDQEPN